MVFNQDPISLELNLTHNHSEKQMELSVDCEIQASTSVPLHTELNWTKQFKERETNT